MDVAVTVALIVLPFIVGLWDDTTALVFYLIVGAGGLVATPGHASNRECLPRTT